MSSAELEARRTEAAAVVAGYRRQELTALTPLELVGWAGRLATGLQSLLDQLDAEQPGQAHIAWLAHQEIAATYQPPQEDK